MKGKEIVAVASLWLLRNLSIVNATINELGFPSVVLNRQRFTRFLNEYVAVKLMEHYQVRTSFEHELSAETSKQKSRGKRQVVFSKLDKLLQIAFILLYSIFIT